MLHHIVYISLLIFQPKIINCLLEKLPVLSTDDDTIRPCFGGQEVDLPRLIVNQFRWLDRIVEGKVYAKIQQFILISRVLGDDFLGGGVLLELRKSPFVSTQTTKQCRIVTPAPQRWFRC